jgi:hypothetical protein
MTDTTATPVADETGAPRHGNAYDIFRESGLTVTSRRLRPR